MSLAMIVSLSSCALGATIFVDNELADDCTAGEYSIAHRDNSGSDGDAYNAIQKAANVTNPGDTVWIRAGTYYETTSTQVAIPVLAITRSGTPQSAITYTNYNGEEVILDAYNPGNKVRKRYAIQLGEKPSSSSDVSGSGVRYVTVCGLIVQGGSYGGLIICGEANKYEVETNPSEYITISHITARNNTGAGIVTMGAVLHTEIAFCEAYGNLQTGIAYGRVEKNWHMEQSDDRMSAARHCLLHNCLSYSNNDPDKPGNTDGICLQNAYLCQVYDNVAYRNSDDNFDVYASVMCKVTDNISFYSNYEGGNNCGFKFSAGGGGRHLISGNISYGNAGYSFEGSQPSNPQREYVPSKVIGNIAIGGSTGILTGTTYTTYPGWTHVLVRNNVAMDHSSNDVYAGNLNYLDSDYNFIGNSINLTTRQNYNQELHSVTGDPNLADPNVTIDTTFQEGWTIEQKLEHIRSQFRTGFSTTIGSVCVDAGIVVSGYHNPMAGDDGGDAKVWFGEVPDIGSFEVVLPRSRM
jgi:hypothetical protein